MQPKKQEHPRLLQGTMSRQEDVVHLFSYDICLFQIKFTGPNTSGLHHIPTMQKRALQMSIVFPCKCFFRNVILSWSLHVLLTFPQEPKLSKFQVQRLKANLEAYSRAGSALFTKHVVMVADRARYSLVWEWGGVSWVLFNSSTEEISTTDTRGVTAWVLKRWHNKKNGWI